MTNELSNLLQQIHGALQLLQESKVSAPQLQNDARGSLPTTDVFFAEHSSLLDKCAQVCALYQDQKPTIRIIHHVACSGGTLISKCLSAMPNIHLLSEVHPYTELHLGSGKPKFSPTDIPSLSKHARIPNIQILMKELFLQNIVSTHKHVSNYGGTLILREHTHSDFHVGNGIADRGSVIDALSDHFDIKSVLTFRDPIDSFLSLKENGWIHFNPVSFEEYCARIIGMLDVYKNTPIFLYESFVEKPSEVLIDICSALSINYDDNWTSFFDVAKVTGDSGRSGINISQRPRKNMDENFKKEILESPSFGMIKNKLKY